MMFSLAVIAAFFFSLGLISPTEASPFPRTNSLASETSLVADPLAKRGGQPYFPNVIPSCVACAPEWSGISSCAEAAPVFDNWMNVIYNPMTFVAQIKCACTDTFQSAYSQCVDCFVQRNQCQEFLGVPSNEGASSIMDGIRQVCGFGSALLGGVAASQSSAGITYSNAAGILPQATETISTAAPEATGYIATANISTSTTNSSASGKHVSVFIALFGPAFALFNVLL